MDGCVDGWDDGGAAKVRKECWAKFRLLGPTSAVHSPSQQFYRMQGEAEPGWFTGQALVFTFCPRSVEPIDGDMGISAAISWMHNIGAESED